MAPTIYLCEVLKFVLHFYMASTGKDYFHVFIKKFFDDKEWESNTTLF